MIDRISRFLQLVYLIKTAGLIVGRTKLQKMVFLLQKENNVQMDYPFRAWIYGPFSREIYEDLELLISEDLVEEEREQIRSNDNQEITRYNYRVTRAGKKLLEANLGNIPIMSMNLLEEVTPHLNRVSTRYLLQIIYNNPKYTEYISKSVLVDSKK